MTKNIALEDRLIFALDVSSNQQAMTIVENLGEAVNFYKLGLEIFMGGNYPQLIDWLVNVKKKKVFADLKFFDVPQTVKSAVRQLSQWNVEFATVHGNDAILKEAAKEKKNLKLLAVTSLTSLDQGDIEDLGFHINVEKLVLSRAKRALELSCDGVISSGIEAPALRKAYGDSFIIVSPGIRPINNTDDQKRTVDIEQAFTNGADYIVVGRPIKEHHGFNSPIDAALSIQQRITNFFQN